MQYGLETAFSANENVHNQFIIFKNKHVGIFSYRLLENLTLEVQAISLLDGTDLIEQQVCKSLGHAIDLIQSINPERFQQKSTSFIPDISHYQIALKSKLGFVSVLAQDHTAGCLCKSGSPLSMRFQTAPEAHSFIGSAKEVWQRINTKMGEKFSDGLDQLIIQVCYTDESVQDIYEVSYS